MRKRICLLFFPFLFLLNVFSQNYTISGYVSDSKTGETLINASVYELNSSKGIVANTYGFYSFTVSGGEVKLRYSYVGYQTYETQFTLSKDTIIHIKLEEHNLLQEVTVLGERQDLGVKGSQMSAIEVSVAQIKAVPTLFGETDVIKALQLLPGVQAGTEGSAGFYVRGGGPDENLFLLDGVPVYNVNHMAGFFSVFNADAIKNVTLYKGGFPARFGGRLSSVLDVQMNDGNNQKLKGNVSVGLISSKFNLEGPLFNQNTTFNISARRTYFDLLAQPVLKIFSPKSAERLRAGYYFYDVNAKVTHKFSDKDRLYLSFYMGDDAIYTNIKEKYNEGSESGEESIVMDWDWGNIITALRWNHVFGNKLFMNTTASYTRYRFDMDIGTGNKSVSVENPEKNRSSNIAMGYKSGIEDISGMVYFDYMPNPVHDIKFGASYIYHTFRPGISVLQEEQSDAEYNYMMDTVIGDKSIYSHETTLYLENNISFGSYVKANIGLHYSTFNVQKQFYHSLQPRVSARVLLNKNLSLKAGYAYMNQYVHLLSNNTISLPTDLWVPVTKRVAPMRSSQVSAGVFYNLLDMIDLSVEGYYKTMDNLIEYKDGSSFLSSATGWEDKISMGRGWAYGIEFLAQKTLGKTTGWIGYTWSKSERLFDRPGEELSNGKPFPAKYDRRHDFSVVVSHKFNDRIDISGTWVYSSGNHATWAMQNYYGPVFSNMLGRPNGSVPYISQRNNFKYPDYHRLDLGINFHKKKKRGIRTWNISVYNAYSRMNPFMITQTTGSIDDGDGQGGGETKNILKKITLFPIIPSISYTFKF